MVAPDHLRQQFEVVRPDAAWVTDITYIRTYEGWLIPGGRAGSVLPAGD